MKDIGKRKKIICAVTALMASVMVTAAVVERRGLLTEAEEARTQRHMAKEVFRFHVLANSDSEEDQALKMKVKESILSYMKEDLPDSKNVEMTKEWAGSRLDRIEKIALDTIRAEGYRYKVHAKVTSCYFPEKRYGDVTFPKGDYEALRIKIGKGKGQNWWCVLYPNLCFIDSVNAVVPEKGKEELREALNEEEYEMVTTTSKFKVKWFFFQKRK